MNLTFSASYLRAKLNTELPPPHDMTLDKRVCRRKAWGAEWNFRIPKDYVKDIFWSHLRFRLIDQDRSVGKEPFMDLFFGNLEGRFSLTLSYYNRLDGDEQDCRKRTRDVEWNSRVSRDCMKGIF